MIDSDGCEDSTEYVPNPAMSRTPMYWDDELNGMLWLILLTM